MIFPVMLGKAAAGIFSYFISAIFVSVCGSLIALSWWPVNEYADHTSASLLPPWRRCPQDRVTGGPRSLEGSAGLCRALWLCWGASSSSRRPANATLPWALCEAVAALRLGDPVPAAISCEGSGAGCQLGLAHSPGAAASSSAAPANAPAACARAPRCAPVPWGAQERETSPPPPSGALSPRRLMERFLLCHCSVCGIPTGSSFVLQEKQVTGASSLFAHGWISLC